jgi:hydroxymethylglutaryl-CoA lyase
MIAGTSAADLALLVGGLMAVLLAASGVGLFLQARYSPDGSNGVVENLNDRVRSWWIMAVLMGIALIGGHAGVTLLFAFCSFAALREVIERFGAQVPINVSLSACFGCPMEGDVPQAEVLQWSQRFADLGVRGLTICDTTGMAQPRQVAAMCEVLQQRFPDLQLTLHFHNTRGMGLANVLAAVQSGIDRFDGSLGGLGGCPYAPGASGNICSEDAIHMLDAMGCDTGIDLQRLLPIARQLPAIVGREVPGQVAKSGLITDLHPAPPSVAELKKEFS